MGVPVIAIAIFTSAGILQMRDCVSPVPASRAFLLSLPASAIAIVLLHSPLTFRLDFQRFALLSGCLGLASLLAGVAIFAYAEILRDQFPPSGLRRTDSA